MRTTGRVAERKVGEHEARHADVLDDVLGAAEDDARDPARLEQPRDQADGLVADRAIGDQDRGVGAVCLAARDDLGAVDLDRRALAAVGRRAVETRRQRADPARRGGAPQRRQREPGAGVLGRRVLAIDRHVRDAQVVIVARVARVDAEEFRARVVRRAGTLIALVRLVRRRGRDERDAARRERAREAMERHLGVMRPFVRRAVAERLVVRADAFEIPDRQVVRGDGARMCGSGAHAAHAMPTAVAGAARQPCAADALPAQRCTAAASCAARTGLVM